MGFDRAWSWLLRAGSVVVNRGKQVFEGYLTFPLVVGYLRGRKFGGAMGGAPPSSQGNLPPVNLLENFQRSKASQFPVFSLIAYLVVAILLHTLRDIAPAYQPSMAIRKISSFNSTFQAEL